MTACERAGQDCNCGEFIETVKCEWDSLRALENKVGKDKVKEVRKDAERIVRAWQAQISARLKAEAKAAKWDKWADFVKRRRGKGALGQLNVIDDLDARLTKAEADVCRYHFDCEGFEAKSKEEKGEEKRLRSNQLLKYKAERDSLRDELRLYGNEKQLLYERAELMKERDKLKERIAAAKEIYYKWEKGGFSKAFAIRYMAEALSGGEKA
jgi:hypothetical protein